MSEPPAAARELFGATLARAEAYAGMLAGPGVERGLIGPGEANRIWDRHLINSGLIIELLPDGLGVPEGESRTTAGTPAATAGAEARGAGRSKAAGSYAEASRGGHGTSGSLVDLGSGAGLPGIVLAILRPDLGVTLIEPMARRTAFLAECVSELDLRNVEICRARAEELAVHVLADVVTSRAVARLDRLAQWSVRLCRQGGLVLAIKGASAAEELEEVRPLLDRLGVADARVVTAGQDLAARGLVEQPTTVIRLALGTRAKVANGRSRVGRRRTGT